jgi:L-ascorbate metabolism protein UlaG (beta-lactamase superfamily)
MKIHYYGHSSLLIELNNGKNILVDPFISANPKASKISIDQIKADYVLLTHAHYDHILDLEAIVSRTKAKIISNHEIVTYYQKHKEFDGHAMNQGGSWDFDFGRLTAVNAVHSSSFPDGTYGGNPLGFILEAEGKCIYLAGDTDLSMEMKLIPLFYTLDLAVLSIGGNFTMDVRRAVVASDFIACNRILGVHYDTAPPIEINHEDALQQFKNKNKELILLDIGGKLEI